MSNLKQPVKTKNKQINTEFSSQKHEKKGKIIDKKQFKSEEKCLQTSTTLQKFSCSYYLRNENW